jgi:hypothetical protein
MQVCPFKCVVDRVALGHIFFFRVLGFSPVYTIPQMLHTRLHLHAVTRKENGRSLGAFQDARLFRRAKSIKRKITFTVFLPSLKTKVADSSGRTV